VFYFYFIFIYTTLACGSSISYISIAKNLNKYKKTILCDISSCYECAKEKKIIK